MKRLVLVAAAVLIPATAQSQDTLANMNLHITGPSYAGCEDAAFDGIDAGDCSGLASDAIDGTAFVWIVASREGGFSGGGVGGAQFGIEHTGVDATGWTLCTGGSEIPEGSWPASGSGNAVTWGGGCYDPAGSAAKVGFLGVNNGATGTIAIIADPRIAEALWASCDQTTFDICGDNLGGAQLDAGTTPVCGDACEGGTPTEGVTWSQVKSLF